MNDKSKVGEKYRVVQIGDREFIVEKKMFIMFARLWVRQSRIFDSESGAAAEAERMMRGDTLYPKVIKTW